MSATWSIPGGVVTLTLDGTGSGQVSRSKTYTGLTPSTLCTFYLLVNTNVVSVGAFFEAVGGDTAVADSVGPHILRVRVTSDGSGAVTLRYGAQHIENAPAAAGSYPLDYPSQAAAEGAGFAVTPGAGGFTFGYAVGLTGYSTGVRITQTGSGATAHLDLALSLTPSTSYTVRLRAKPLVDSAWWNDFSLILTSGTNTANDTLAGNAAERTLSATITTDGTGALNIRMQLPAVGFYSSFVFAGLEIEGATGGGATLTFDNLTRCAGSGLSETGGTGAGATGTDPLPPAPSGGTGTPGVRPFGAFSIPASGLNYWNATVKEFTKSWTVNLLNSAATAGAYLFGVFGQTADWLDGSGVFSYDKWQATVDAVHNDPVANAALVAKISSGTAFAHYLIDEPEWSGRWGITIPIATLERMALHSKSLWPTWKTTIRVGATDKVNGSYYISRHINGLDWLWAQYWTRYGDVTAYRDNEIARATLLGHKLVIGINIADFLGASTRPITPAELDYYGSILADGDNSVIMAFMMWQFESGLYAQPGFEDAVGRLRDRLRSNDP